MAPHKALQNRILRQLPAHELKAIEPKLTTIDLKQETVLYPPDAQINRIYFPLAGMISLLAVTPSGDAIETGIVGADGVLGGSCAMDGGISLGQATVQLDAVALKMNASDFKAAYGDHSTCCLR